MPASASPLRILHVVDSLERGGLERLVTELSIAQAAAGHRVGVYSLLATGGFLDELERAGVPVTVGHKRGGLDRHVLAGLRAQARRVDVVHAHSFVPSYYAAASMLALTGAPPLVATCHDMGTRLANRRLALLFRWAARRAARVTMVGEQVRERFVGDGLVAGAKALTVMNAVPVERYGRVARADARAALGLPPEGRVIGCIGRLVALKNHRLMLDILPALRRDAPDLRLLLVGAGPLEAELRAHAGALGLGDAVQFAGLRTDIETVLQAIDVFAMPSLTEGLSIALLEAGAAARPIVATRVGGNGEIVRDGVSGLLVPPADGPALQSALARLVADPALARSLGAAAQAWVRAHASLESLCRTYDTIYRDAAVRPAARP